MKKNYLILVHINPEQVCRLINRLEDGESKFFVHVDLKSKLDDFEVVKNLSNTMIISERENCIWGDFSIVRATLHLLRNAVESGEKGFTILLSGQDYPIKPNNYINQFLNNYKNFNFIDVTTIEEKWSKKMVRNKVEHYHFIHSEKKSDSNSYAPFYHSSLKEQIRNIFHFAKGRMSLKTFKELMRLPKRNPFFKNQYAGSQWWAFNEKTAKLLYDYINSNNEALENYYKFSSAPDEIFFQTILMNLIGKEIKIKPSQTYVNWERKNCVLPVTFNDKNFDELLNLDQLWARKFDQDYNDKILDLIDSEILKK